MCIRDSSIGTTAAAPSSGLIVSGNVGIGNTSPGAKLDVGLAGTTLSLIHIYTVSYGLTNTASNQINIGNTIYGNLHAASGGTALTIGSTGHDGAIMTFAGDGGIVLPSGSTAQRPGASVANGMIRYNSCLLYTSRCV